MADPAYLLTERLRGAFDSVSPGSDPVLRRSERADFQANGALALAKKLGITPHNVAARVVAALDVEGICSTVEVSGPGFVNLTLSDGFLQSSANELLADPRLGVEHDAQRRVVVIDYSAPNVAKEMHVGHLRSTVIGDALARVHAHVGHEVIRENHVGDWGTPFGMLIEHLCDLGEDEAIAELSVGDLNGFYRAARISFDADERFAERSRRRVVLLQAEDPETLRLWRILVDQSVHYFDEVYAKLGVLLTSDDVVGESFYNPMLDAVVADLDKAGMLVNDDGATCVFAAGFTNREGDPLPLIVKKRDGGFGYAATDLACIRDRIDRLGGTDLLYVVGAPQAQHLEMVYAVARQAGWLPAEVTAVHVSFGSVLGTDRKMLKSRAGDSVKLVELIDEAIKRADQAIVSRDDQIDKGLQMQLAKSVGVGAIKYADLSTERQRDYVFDLERMVAFEGDTGPYLQYAHARIRSIFRRGDFDAEADSSIVIGDPAERALVFSLLEYPSAIEEVLSTSSPSKLCAYLYSVAGAFTTFYERCPVLRAKDPATRASRLALCALSATVLSEGLGLLGIDAPDQM